MAFHTWLLFSAAYLATTISPGPNVLLVIRNTVRYGAAGTAATILGNLLTQLIVVFLVAAGVGAVLLAIPPLFLAMKIAGAGYLIYLGLKQLLSRSAKKNNVTVVPVAHVAVQSKIFWEAMLVSGSNPKTLIFLSAFMPQFIEHGRPLSVQFFVMYLSIAAIVALVHSVYALSVRRISQQVGTNGWVDRVKRLSGVIFVGLGIKLLTTKAA
ncbi:LysE family translocator [Buttiauxella sp.]|uniref:LysE family translocator n=1 Tax=Buttiauxella sp. TaxID=1972222 RepID=UPI003C7915C4